jgi:hypothetical protein
MFGNADPNITSKFKQKSINECYKETMYIEKYCKLAKTVASFTDLLEVYKQIRKHQDAQTTILKSVSEAEAKATVPLNDPVNKQTKKKKTDFHSDGIDHNNSANWSCGMENPPNEVYCNCTNDPTESCAPFRGRWSPR